MAPMALASALLGLVLSPLSLCSQHLIQSADAVVAAAAVLGENQRQEEEPGRLSAGGCALANAARDCEDAADALFVEREWASTVGPLASVSACLGAAAVSLEGIGGDELQAAADEIEEAASVTGCISLAAAAGPNLQDAGDALVAAAAAFEIHGDGLESGATAAHVEAGRRFAEAAAAMQRAGAALRATGERLEAGRLEMDEG